MSTDLPQPNRALDEATTTATLTRIVRFLHVVRVRKGLLVTSLFVAVLLGGLSSTVADKVYVIRPLPDDSGQTAVIEVSLMEAKRDASRNIRLGPRDLVSIEHTPATMLLELVKIIRFGVGASLTPLF